MFNKIVTYATLFMVGGFVYTVMEILWDSSTHYSMFILGGISLILIGLLNEKKKMSILKQALVGGAIITILELVTGLLINSDYTIWDYRSMPFNFMGQICLLFSAIWCLVSIFAVWLDDHLREKVER